jgi:hypothetical protein
MENSEVTVDFVDNCVKCDKSMISDDGKRIGGLMRSVKLGNATIYGTKCWECVMAPDSEIWEEKQD